MANLSFAISTRITCPRATAASAQRVAFKAAPARVLSRRAAKYGYRSGPRRGCQVFALGEVTRTGTTEELPEGKYTVRKPVDVFIELS